MSARCRVLPGRAQTFLWDNLSKDLSCVVAQLTHQLRCLFALVALLLRKRMALLPRRTVRLYMRPHHSTKKRMP